MKEVSDIVLFFGRFHPLVVHLPIGFLFFAFILEIMAKFQKKEVLRAAIPLALFFGAISAIIACILGYMLSLSGDYDTDALDTHFWFGIVTTVIVSIAWILKTDKLKNKIPSMAKMNMATITFIVVLLSITGHYGGNLTHGSDYLTTYLPFGKKEKIVIPKINSVEEAQLFAHVVNPILQKKCASCHNTGKKKGGLSLEGEPAILKGGKHGEVIVVGNSKQSELIRRVHLDPEEEEFMPPEGKTPLTKEQIQIIEYWIDQGQASFDKNIGTIETPDEMKTLLAQELGIMEKPGAGVILATAPAIPDSVYKELANYGIRIRELVAETNQLEISILPAGKEKLSTEKVSNVLRQLSKIKDNIVQLSIPENGVNDEHLKIIGTFQRLKKLGLEKNTITDKGLTHLVNLKELESLNLYNNEAITNKGTSLLSTMKNLKRIYVWGTTVEKKENDNKEDKENSQKFIF